MPIDLMTIVYKLPRIKDEPIDVDAIEPELNMEFDEYAPQQQGIIHEVYERPSKKYLQKSPDLQGQVDSKNLVQRYLPKQVDRDKILKIIQRKVLKGTHLPITVKEIQAGYLNNPHFKAASLCLVQNKIPSYKAAIRRTEILAEMYLLLNSSLHKLNTTHRKNM